MTRELDEGMWHVVRNASDPAMHEVAWCATPDYAAKLAAGMNAEHGWAYVVEEHTGDETCQTCQAERVAEPGAPIPAILCYPESAIDLTRARILKSHNSGSVNG